MTTDYTGASTFLDGFVAGPGESGFEHLFAWYASGSHRVSTANPGIQLSLNDASHEHYRRILDATARSWWNGASPT